MIRSTPVRDSRAERGLLTLTGYKKEPSLSVPCDKNQIQKCKENILISDV